MRLSTLALAAALAGLPVATAYAQGAATALPPLEGPAGTPQWAPSNLRHVSRSAANVLPHPKFDDAALASQAAAAATIPLFSKSVKVDAALGGNTDVFKMVGRDPTVHQITQTTTIKTVVVPVVFTFKPQNVVFDPTKADTCTAKSAEALTLASPMFKNITLTVGGTRVGTGQFPDLFQRANFWRFTKAGATNPNYKLVLSPVTDAALKITVNGGTVDTNVPCGKLGLIDINSWDAFVQGTIFPALKASLTPTTIPFFLFYNVVLFDTTINNCCILGYHNAFNNPSFGNAFQTYGIAEFDETHAFNNVADTSILSHEINEWQDDPTGTNPTPAWGHVGQVGGCQGNLEVGDPLSGTFFAIPLSGFTYHVQDLAFASWFYRHDAKVTGISGTIGNFGVNGWFSLFGTFRTDAGALCH